MTKICLLAAAFFVLYCSTGCLSQYNNYGVVDVPVISIDQQFAVALVAANHAVSHQENGGYVHTSYSTTYWLKQYELASGKLVNKQKLELPKDAPSHGVTILGAFNNWLWLYAGQLLAYDLHTLQQVMDESTLAAATNSSPDIFPFESRMYYPDPAQDCIVFVAPDGRRYKLRLTASRPVIEAVQGNELPSQEQAFSAFRDDQYGVRSDSIGNQRFAFAKDSSFLQSAMQQTDLSEVNYRMQLYKVPFTLQQWAGTYLRPQYGPVQQLGTSSWLNPCFATDINTGQMIRLPATDGCFIIHQDVLGSKSQAIFTGIDLQGKQLWQIKPGISTKINSCVQSGHYCIVTGNQQYMFSPFIGKDALCIVNLQRGSSQLVAMQD